MSEYRLNRWRGLTRQLIVSLGLVGVLTVLSGSSAFAEHDHYLVTPGACVVDIARGQTSIDDVSHAGYHRYHFNVHLGTSGVDAFANANNPVAVYKTGTGPGCP